MTDKEILRKALEEANLTQTELAGMVGVSRASVSTNIRRDNMGLDIFVHYLNLMGYVVFVGEKRENMFFPKWEALLM